MLASPTTQSLGPAVPASRPELAKGQAQARFIKGSAWKATALRNFPNASVGSGDLRRPGQLRSQRSCPVQAAQSRRVIAIAALPRGTRGYRAGAWSPTTGPMHCARLPRGEAARGRARRAGPRPRQLLSKMDAMCPPRRLPTAACTSSVALCRPGAWARPARPADGSD